MKKSVLLFVLLGLLITCSKDDDSGTPYMGAKIDGSDWKAITRVTVLEDEKFVITGTALNGEVVAITVFGTSEDTYELGLTSAGCAAVYKKSGLGTPTEDTYVSATGEVILTDVNTSAQEISGTFSFTLVKGLLNSTLTITDGSFQNLSYTITNN